jgi:hypothetical protein
MKGAVRDIGPTSNFLIDTDTASDDAVAIMMSLADPDLSRRPCQEY